MAVFSLYAQMECLLDLQTEKQTYSALNHMLYIVTSLATGSTLTYTDSSNLLNKASIKIFKTNILLIARIKFSVATEENNKFLLEGWIAE
jgi:hypothetical protein